MIMQKDKIETLLKEECLITEFTGWFARYEISDDEVTVHWNFDIMDMTQVEKDIKVSAYKAVCDNVYSVLQWTGFRIKRHVCFEHQTFSISA